MNSKITKLLTIARWAPSGDNQQTWRFKIIDENHFMIFSTDTRDTCWLDCLGRGSQLALGALIENIAIAAGQEGFEAHFEYEDITDNRKINVQVELTPNNSEFVQSLYPFIEKRVTNRFPLSRQRLSAAEKEQLSESIDPDYDLVIIDQEKNKQKMAALAKKGAKVRLLLPNAYEDISKIIDWNQDYSENKLPAKSLGIPIPMLFFMKMVLKSKKSFDFLNRYLGGDALSTLILDYLPNRFCGGHFFLFAKQGLHDEKSYVEAGRRLQRMWLTATANKLFIQPLYTPIAFYLCNAANECPTQDKKLWDDANKVIEDLKSLLAPHELSNLFFMGRIGKGSPPDSRAVRLPLEKLLI